MQAQEMIIEALPEVDPRIIAIQNKEVLLKNKFFKTKTYVKTKCECCSVVQACCSLTGNWICIDCKTGINTLYSDAKTLAFIFKMDSAAFLPILVGKYAIIINEENVKLLGDGLIFIDESKVKNSEDIVFAKIGLSRYSPFVVKSRTCDTDKIYFMNIDKTSEDKFIAFKQKVPSNVAEEKK